MIIKGHIFFKDLDWKKLLKKELKPPLEPKVKNATDTSNVDEEFTDEIPKDTLVDKTGSMIDAVPKSTVREETGSIFPSYMVGGFTFGTSTQASNTLK